MSGDSIGNDVRKLRRARRLGRGAACVVCGETNPEQLQRAAGSLLERHHLAGRANDPQLTVVLCRNHHAQLSELQRDSGLDLHENPTRPAGERTAALLRGLADLAELSAPHLRRHADALEADRIDINPTNKEES
jgi:hypothetical protein